MRNIAMNDMSGPNAMRLVAERTRQLARQAGFASGGAPVDMAAMASEAAIAMDKLITLFKQSDKSPLHGEEEIAAEILKHMGTGG
jgi:hypothetical protein